MSSEVNECKPLVADKDHIVLPEVADGDWELRVTGDLLWKVRGAVRYHAVAVPEALAGKALLAEQAALSAIAAEKVRLVLALAELAKTSDQGVILIEYIERGAAAAIAKVRRCRLTRQTTQSSSLRPVNLPNLRHCTLRNYPILTTEPRKMCPSFALDSNLRRYTKIAVLEKTNAYSPVYAAVQRKLVTDEMALNITSAQLGEARCVNAFLDAACGAHFAKGAVAMAGAYTRPLFSST